MSTTTHLLLDIEGTTCPITFVSGVLFPYAKAELAQFLAAHQHESSVQGLISDAWKEWRRDPDSTSQSLLQSAPKEKEDIEHRAIIRYLQHLIEIDKKSTALKDLQGKIWKQGYENGQIQTALFPETTAALKRWSEAGLKLAVYSSGSVAAQQLLYNYTSEGDLRQLFCGWFDTHTGNKKEPTSYRAIAQRLQAKPEQVTFISDSRAECDAAAEAGLSTLFSLRDGNPDQVPGNHPVITDLSDVTSRLT